MTSIKQLLRCLFFLFFFSFGTSQTSKKLLNSIEDKRTFYLLDVEKGLSSDVIYSIEQDSLGFIWIGTSEGLNRYDGTQFKVYKKNDLENFSNISNNFIYEIRYLNNGRLLINTAEGINIYDTKRETFKVLEENNTLFSTSASYFTYGHEEPFIMGLDSGIQSIDKQKKQHLIKIIQAIKIH